MFSTSPNSDHSSANRLQNISVLGSTGSVGVSTLDVISRNLDRYVVFALAANTRVDLMLPQVQAFRPKYAVMNDPSAAQQLQSDLLELGQTSTEVLCGDEGLRYVAAHEYVDTVMAAIVGSAGLASTMAAVESGKKVLLANKESLVMAGHLLMDAVERSGATILPIDSEHNAIFQCMPANFRQGLSVNGVRKILLTGSGGPFRLTPPELLSFVTPNEACAHPNWDMGRKISVDSATMMNKGLEFIEACWFFDATPDQVEIVIHPQSVIHSMVEYLDGSVIAQLGNPDMRTPIAHCLAYPDRIESGVARLDIIATARLDFEAPDMTRFPCLRLANEAVRAGGIAMAVLNAANEIAVNAFLEQRIRFTDIPVIIEKVLDNRPSIEPESLSLVKEADTQSRRMAAEYIRAI
ncbi:MAG: 1-deoxy-D-xylulose-5-phosphate reductoisomerase [Oceanicoccus sp.]|jgi:1-deoxy-D-xylulose-5-phosphate reductoisomerase